MTKNHRRTQIRLVHACAVGIFDSVGAHDEPTGIHEHRTGGVYSERTLFSLLGRSRQKNLNLEKNTAGRAGTSVYKQVLGDVFLPVLQILRSRYYKNVMLQIYVGPQNFECAHLLHPLPPLLTPHR